MDDTSHVRCMICGAWKKELNGHIRMHGVSSNEYKRLYPGMPMASPASILAKSASIKGKLRKSPDLSQDDRDRRRQRLIDRWAKIKAEMGDDAYASMKMDSAEAMRTAKGLNYRHSDATKEKMRGPRMHVRGIPRSDEHRAKLSAAAKSRASNGLRSDETKAKMREAWVRRKANRESYQAYVDGVRERMTTPEAISRIRDNVSKRLQNPDYNQRQYGTGIEIRLKEWLDVQGISYVHQHQLTTPIGTFTYDFFLPDMRLLVEVDGEYWHRKNLEQVNRDRLKIRLAKEAGIGCVRISDIDWRPEMILASPNEIDQHNDAIIQLRLDHLRQESS